MADTTKSEGVTSTTAPSSNGDAVPETIFKFGSTVASEGDAVTAAPAAETSNESADAAADPSAPDASTPPTTTPSTDNGEGAGETPAADEGGADKNESVEEQEQDAGDESGPGGELSAMTRNVGALAVTESPDAGPSLDEILALGQGLNDQDYQAQLEIQQSDPNSNLFSASTFEDLNLPETLLQGIYGMKFNKPSVIQSVAMPMAISDPPTNLIAQAQSGSGKTATFSLAMLCRVDLNKKHPQAVCVAPTRELAKQIMAVVRVMGRFMFAAHGLSEDQATYLAVPEDQRGFGPVHAPIVVGTPGRTENKIKHRDLDVKSVRVLVFDEADHMVDDFSNQTRNIHRFMPRGCQVLLFSATFPDAVLKMAEQVAPAANKITLQAEQLSLDAIKQFWLDTSVNANGKFEVLCDIYDLMDVGKSIIFVEKRSTCKLVAKQLRQRGFTCSLLHGNDMAISTRDDILDDFRRGRTKVLITTNVLARGIDVQGVHLVINYDLPRKRDKSPDYETYLHRIGRTGRFGRSGNAINFADSGEDKVLLAQIERYFQRQIVQGPSTDVEALEKLLNA